MSSERNVNKKKVNAYATALLEGCSSKEQLFEVTGELKQTVRLITESTDLQRVLTVDPILTASDRAGLVEKLFEVSAPLMTILKVIAERRELALVHRINDEFIYLAEDSLGAIIVDVTTAIPLDNELRDIIKKKLVLDFNQDVLLRERVDSSIIGGVILSTHGKRIDASIASLLHLARRVLSTSTPGGEN